eukprot:3933494-Pleurochrysis_carterae.AAC.2
MQAQTQPFLQRKAPSLPGVKCRRQPLYDAHADCCSPTAPGCLAAMMADQVGCEQLVLGAEYVVIASYKPAYLLRTQVRVRVLVPYVLCQPF